MINKRNRNVTLVYEYNIILNIGFSEMVVHTFLFKINKYFLKLKRLLKGYGLKLVTSTVDVF